MNSNAPRHFHRARPGVEGVASALVFGDGKNKTAAGALDIRSGKRQQPKKSCPKPEQAERWSKMEHRTTSDIRSTAIVSHDKKYYRSILPRSPVERGRIRLGEPIRPSSQPPDSSNLYSTLRDGRFSVRVRIEDSHHFFNYPACQRHTHMTVYATQYLSSI